MEMNYYLEAAVLPIELLLCIYLHIKYRDASPVNRAFRHFAYAVLVASALDVLFAMNYNRHARHSALYYLLIDMVIHSAAFFAAIAFLRYIIAYLQSGETGRNLRLVLRAVIACYAFFWVQNFFTGSVVVYDEYGYYSEGIMFEAVIYAAPAVVIIGSVLLMITNQNRFEFWQWIAILTGFLVAGLVFFIQILFYRELLVIFFISALCLYVLFFCVETPMYRQLAGRMDELEQLREEALQSQAQAEEENRQKSVFLENMAREIGVPMKTILQLDERILKETVDREIRRCAMQIDNAGLGLMRMINDILDLSQMENGRLSLEPVSYHLGRVLAEAESATRTKAGLKGIVFDAHYAPSLPDDLYGDEKRLAQIIACLLDNAVRYTSAGNITLSVTGKRQFNKIFLHIEVADTGVGISEEQMPHLYEAFYRAEKETDLTERGTGLTLAITKMLVELMGGTIDVSSVIERGTTFHVVIPQEIRGERTVGDYMKERII